MLKVAAGLIAQTPEPQISRHSAVCAPMVEGARCCDVESHFVLDYNTHTRWWIQRMDLYHDMDEEDRERERKKDEEREKKKPPEMRLCRSSPRTSLTPTSLAT